ncbi:hypothetical protein GCM10022243_52680 [Saccharothrix violaceirubra]|uniref:DUF397 domain-containing protein n=1 Tax=Saccharothrix violaceirubra TaxID=413306 RepID=A0A7W7T130_9PSEU|nr:DUF397 domain-containing protein [Saccharothrix violaceirubra]MBB4963330.1 hypothetical protein [Saccharothrix violaceirubra]
MTPDFTAASFKTSSYTEANGTCVEVAQVPGFVAVRDTKHRSGGHIAFPDAAFRAFVARVRA